MHCGSKLVPVTIRDIPIQVLASELGLTICFLLPAMYAGCDFVCYLYEENKSGASGNGLRYRMFTEIYLSRDRLPSALEVLVLYLQRALIFFQKSFISFIKTIKYNIEKTFSFHKIPLYIKQVFSYDIKNIQQMLFF